MIKLDTREANRSAAFLARASGSYLALLSRLLTCNSPELRISATLINDEAAQLHEQMKLETISLVEYSERLLGLLLHQVPLQVDSREMESSNSVMSNHQLDHSLNSSLRLARELCYLLPGRQNE